jgi:hypothetical protein
VVEKKTIHIMMNWQKLLKKQARGLTECDVAEDATPNGGKIGMLGKYTTAKSNFSESTKALGELSKMESASQIFDIQILGGSKNGAILYNQSSGAIDIQVNRNSKSGVIASLAHELKHGFQFLTGEVTFTRRPGETHAISGSLYGPEDEFGAFKRQDLITGGTTNIEDIRATYKDETNRGGSLKQMTPKRQDRYIRKNGTNLIYNKNFNEY